MVHLTDTLGTTSNSIKPNKKNDAISIRSAMSIRLIDVPAMIVSNILALISWVSAGPNGVATGCVRPSATNPTMTI